MAKNFLSRPSAWAVNSRGLHPGQFAPGGGELRSRLYEPLAHVRGGCTPGNSRLGAVSCAHACTNRWRTCAAGVISQANMPHGSAGQFAGVAPRAIRANGRQATLAPVQEDSARARGLHPRQFAPGGGELRSRLYKPLAHVRGGCTPGNSRLGAVSCAHACTNRWRACAPGVSPGRGHRWQKAKREKAVTNATGLLSLA